MNRVFTYRLTLARGAIPTLCPGGRTSILGRIWPVQEIATNVASDVTPLDDTESEENKEIKHGLG